jgi:predicted ribosome quality control (RQC) complex YloA/Tae2 family protein
MKQNLTSHDIRALVQEYQKYIGMYMNNVYDVDNKTFVMKLSGEQKVYLLLESGLRLHTLAEFEAIKTLPGSFCAKLRKHIRNWRLYKITQVNNDRVVDFQFGPDEKCFHIIFELYASGNIILTDIDFMIMALIHPHVYKDQDERKIVKTGKQYPFEFATADPESFNIKKEDVDKWLNNIKEQKSNKLRQFLSWSPFVNFGIINIEHCLFLQNINSKEKYGDGSSINLNIDKFIEDMMNLHTHVFDIKGYLIKDIGFYPYKYSHLEGYVEYESFDKLVQEWFGPLKCVIQKAQDKLKRKEHGLNKNDNIKESIDTRVITLKNKQNDIKIIIDIIEETKEFLETCHKNFRDQNNVNYKNKTFDITVSDIIVTLDYSKSINQNVQDMYSKIKHVQTKIDKSYVAINCVEKQQKEQVIQKEVTTFIQDINRKQLYFEQFNWFLSSDDFIVISGKTSQLNEQIVKKYLDKNDIYVHSDVPGSGSCVIKNPNNKTVPIKTIDEAGTFVICHTKSWDSTVPDKSWYVNADQVSKTTETGEYVGTGSFIIRGKKNYISANKMEMGFGILFWNGFTLDRQYSDKTKFAVVTCCPYKSALNYKYKKKIIPGNGKIGKTVQLIKDSFCKDKSIEKSYIKNIPIDDWHRVAPGKMKAM